MRILAVGDSYMPPRYFAEAFAELEAAHVIEYLQVDEMRRFVPSSPSEREGAGVPGLTGRVRRADARRRGARRPWGARSPTRCSTRRAELRLVCCARGGPVNVDVEAVSARDFRSSSTPGKNAEAVADLTIAFLVIARARASEGAALPRGRQPAPRQLGGREVHGQRPPPPRARPRRLRPGRAAGGRAGAAVRDVRGRHTTHIVSVDGRSNRSTRSTSCSRAPTSSRSTRARPRRTRT